MQATDIQPPAGLFSRIIRRLGLERQLQTVKRHLGFFVALACVFCVLTGLAAVGLTHVLARSSFGSVVSLAFSDPGMMFKHRHDFASSVGESIPGISLAPALFSIGFLMLLARLIAVNTDKLSSLITSIQKQKDEHH